MNPVLASAFNDEMEKIAIRETLRIGKKALKAALRGGTKLEAPAGVFQSERQGAVTAGQDLIRKMKAGGHKVHRARVKSPSSITAGGHTSVPNDLLGMQAYARNPRDVQMMVNRLKASGASISGVSAKTRPGYHGVNIKGTYNGSPFEMQASPSRRSNMGQIMEHSLGYKVKTEAPKANRFDKWFGRKVAPRMVNWDNARKIHPRADPSWINEHKAVLDAIR